MKKNQHPYVESGYINGYRKDISLKNLSDFDMIIDKLNYLRYFNSIIKVEIGCLCYLLIGS